MNSVARLMSKLGMPDAEHSWQALIEQNPECHQYYKGFLQNRGIDLGAHSFVQTRDTRPIKSYLDAMTEETRGLALQSLLDFSQQLNRATAPRRLALNLAQGTHQAQIIMDVHIITESVGDQFRNLADAYLRAGLEKGIPSLFADVKALYKDVQKQQVIEDLVETLRESLLPLQPSDSSNIEPTTYLWTLYFLAQHHSYLSRHKRALELLRTAMDHTPTLPELYIFQARVLKRCGDPIGAARSLDEARVLDLQDRFLNTKCAKYRMRAGHVDEAADILGLFTKASGSHGGRPANSPVSAGN